MELTTLKDKIRATYTKEYARNLRLSFRQKLMAYPAGALLLGSAWLIAGGALAGAAGAITAPLWIAGGAAAALVGGGLALATVISTQSRAKAAVETDIDNGKLITRYDEEVLKKTPAPAPAAPASSLETASAKTAFNNPEPAAETPGTQPKDAPKPPAL